MTLWDQKPLTEEEIAARLMCVCAHPFAKHRASYFADMSGKNDCALCDCDEFEEVRS